MKKLLIPILSFSIMCGCVSSTGYQPYKEDFLHGSQGYKEMKLSENSYLVEYFSNSSTDKSTNMKHAMHRAAELTQANGYKYFEITNNVDNSEISFHKSSRKSVYAHNPHGFHSMHEVGSTTKTTTTDMSTKPIIALTILMSDKKSKNSIEAESILSNYAFASAS